MKAQMFFAPEMVELLQTVQAGDETKARSLLNRGLDMNIRGDEGITPLFWLIMQKNNKAVELLLKLGADPNFPAMTKGDRNGPWPLWPLAAVAGDGDNGLFKILLQNSADPNSRNALGQPAIFACIGHDNWGQLELLLKFGVNLNATDGTGRNSALYAAYLDRYDWAYKLIKLGASPSQPNSRGVTIAYLIDGLFASREKNPAFRISEDTLRTKSLLIERGISFPALSPKEVRESLQPPNR